MTDRQTDKLNPSVPYDTFACFAGLIIINNKEEGVGRGHPT